MKDNLPPAFLGRRAFLRGMGALALTAPSLLADLNPDAGKNSAGIPLRVLGRTKEKITILGLGTAPVGMSKPGRAAGVPVFRAALEAGINYVDTAHNYDDAEDYLSEVLLEYRDKIFLTTKALPHSDDPREAAREMQTQFEDSLRRLKTSHVDLLHIHSIGDKPPAMILAPGGPMDFVKKMKAQGLTRFIGVTGHNHVPRFAELINSGEVDVVMVTLNFADYHQYHFEEEILPVARRHGCGILAMKVYGGHSQAPGGYARQGPSMMPVHFLEQSMHYSMGIPGVSAAVIGPYTVAEAKQNVAWAKRYTSLSLEETARLREQGKSWAAAWGPRFGPVA
ncbi:MAG TPA: aldo/keto reductase [Candidatus Saccharimonadales bacterium]|nr:aldo/keto reductase [Candidatus Saccharimonadales bacterium]